MSSWFCWSAAWPPGSGFGNTGSRERPQDRLLLFGNVDIRQVQLAFNGNERIAALLVEEGDRVKTGQLLARLDTQRLEPKAASREAQVQAQREVVARLEAGNRPEEVRKAKADLEAAKADLVNAELTYKRIIQLTTQGVETPQRKDDVRRRVGCRQSARGALPARPTT